MTKKPVKPKVVESVAEQAAEAPVFTPCRQCGNPGGCARANRCVKGFK
jgi:hypothetical protein